MCSEGGGADSWQHSHTWELRARHIIASYWTRYKNNTRLDILLWLSAQGHHVTNAIMIIHRGVLVLKPEIQIIVHSKASGGVCGYSADVFKDLLYIWSLTRLPLPAVELYVRWSLPLRIHTTNCYASSTTQITPSGRPACKVRLGIKHRILFYSVKCQFTFKSAIFFYCTFS